MCAPRGSAQTNLFSDYNTVSNILTKFRIGFDSSCVIHRQLVLALKPKASLRFDNLFDGKQNHEQFDDMAVTVGTQN